MDQTIFTFLNGTIHTPVLDPIMVWITDSDRVMQGTVAAMLLYLVVQKGSKRAWLLIVGAFIAFALADSLAYRVFKPFFGRVRPANAAYFLDGVNQFLTGCRFLIGTNDSMSTPSNHAANMFAQATYWSLFYPKWAKLLFPVGFLVAYTRIYVGVHYPFDIFLGAILGTAVAIAVYLGMNRLPPLSSKR